MSNGDKHSQKRNYMKNWRGSKAQKKAAEAKKEYHRKKEK